ncbi:hypothetical protein GCM10027456_31060 [Kineosporia babensis]
MGGAKGLPAKTRRAGLGREFTLSVCVRAEAALTRTAVRVRNITRRSPDRRWSAGCAERITTVRLHPVAAPDALTVEAANEEDPWVEQVRQWHRWLWAERWRSPESRT